ncbi:sensor histidine kinase [Salinactinospora qingdaonensis]
MRAALDRAWQIWTWGWQRRYRVADWSYAIWYFPFVAMGNALGQGARPFPPFVPGGLELPFTLTVFLLLPALVSLTILWRRSRPGYLLALSVLLLFGFANFVPATIALYSYAAWFSDRRRLALWSGAVLAALLFSYPPLNSEAPTFMLVIVALVVPLTVGLWAGTRRQLVANLRERAERLEREQHLKAERAIIAERTRIAHEMHDVVAHRVSLMVLHAGGLEVSATDGQTAQTAGVIRTTGREALAELREILGVLRDDPAAAAPTAPQPVLADLHRLIEQWRTAGMDVSWHTGGTPRPLSVQLERTAYRAVQEGLTNAAKHAPATAVVARLDYGSDELAVLVANGPPATPVSGDTRHVAPPAGGYGLAGLHERVLRVGGRLCAGPTADGGWRVRAVLPAAPVASDEAPHSDGPSVEGR